MKSGPAQTCRDEQRRHAVRASQRSKSKKKKWNGLDYLEVGPDQRTLKVYFLGKAPAGLAPENVRIEPCSRGGRKVRVTDLRPCRLEDPELDDCLHVTVDRPGDFSPYTLCLVEVDRCDRPTGEPYRGFDPRYACLEFSFKVDCASGLDCKPPAVCPPPPRTEPEINYLAKDYTGFRQLILDRLALTLPEWRERHVPDLGIALVETLAYAGDHLSYYQDAVATEAYLDTARRRISVRRHVRLVDYPMHEGCNARAWVCVETDADLALAAGDFYCITGFEPSPPAGQVLTKEDLSDLPADRYLVFEPVARDPAQEIALRPAHNEIRFYTWGDDECCLPRGTSRATLRDAWLPRQRKKRPPGRAKAAGDDEPAAASSPAGRRRRLALQAGDLLLFEEVLGPKTGHPADADRAHRHVVRLTRVEACTDKLTGTPLLKVEWHREDALPFPLCISAVGGPECRLLEPVSVARGNVFLVDHGRTVEEELGVVPPAAGEVRCEGRGRRSQVPQRSGRWTPVLARAPLTFRRPQPSTTDGVSASRLMDQDPRRALPEIRLAASPAAFDAPHWSVRRDLLDSGPDDLHFVAEVDDDGRAHLRFGDGDTGFAPPAGTSFSATYRVGNGPAGNVGPEAIRHLVLRSEALSGVRLQPRNPLPARGGTAPEPLAEVRLLAPHAFRRDLQRAITGDDYARLVERQFPGRVQRAAATLRWTGSWTEVLVAVDPLTEETDVPRLLREIRHALRRYRRIGHDVAVERALPVSLDVELLVCVQPHFQRAHVEAALLDVLGPSTLADGRRGFFHPDELTFGQGIALSRLVAAAQAVEGVESVAVQTFQRLGEGPRGEIENGFLALGPLEIARLDNDPRFPGHGRLKLTMRGGR